MSTQAWIDELTWRRGLAQDVADGAALLTAPITLLATTYGGPHDPGTTGHDGYHSDDLTTFLGPWPFAELSENPTEPDVHKLLTRQILMQVPLAQRKEIMSRRQPEDPKVGLPHIWPLVFESVADRALHERVVGIKLDIGRGNARTLPQIDLWWQLANWLGVDGVDARPWQGHVSVKVALP